jgi:putative hydrolase of the HAD superfamily
MIRAVTFDFWGTLYFETARLDERRRLRSQYAQGFLMSLGKDCPLDKVTSALELVFRQIESLRTRDNVGMGAAEIGQRVLDVLGFVTPETKARELGELISSAALEYPPRMAEGAIDVLRELKAKAKLAVISDTGMTLGKDLYALMERDGLAGFFDTFTFSDQTGTTKPMTRQFLYTLFRLDVMPQEAVHVGDLEDSDIAGAHESGMRAVRISEHDEKPTQAEAAIKDIRELPPLLRRWM